MTFKLVPRQANVVQLAPSCPKKLPLIPDKETVGEFTITEIIVQQPVDSNKDQITVKVYIRRSFMKSFSTTYLPTFCLLILVQMTFYFPEDNFQVRATVSLSCLLILSTLFGTTARSLPTTTKTTFIEIWMMFAGTYVLTALKSPPRRGFF